MKKIIVFLIFILLSSVPFQVIGNLSEDIYEKKFNRHEPKINNLYDTDIHLTKYSEYINKYEIEQFNVEKIYPKIPNINSYMEKIFIFVPSTIYDEISFELFQYANDLSFIGFSCEIYSGEWGTPEEVKIFLKSIFTEDVVGCVMIGNIPCAWYELIAFNQHEEFPSDLYYMDLDGNWYDSDDDGIYDSHITDIEPEIWISRIKADVLSGDEIDLYKNYFDKCHRFRIKSYELSNKALVYVDDDWVDEGGSRWNDQVKNAYKNTDLIIDEWTTDKDDYVNRLIEDYEMVHLAVHSTYEKHHFINPDDWSGVFHFSEIKNIDPHILFYNLFACSAARYIEDDYIAGWYIFTDTYSLLAIGSTKIGGMWASTPFYSSLGDDNCFGGAFKNWFATEGIYRPDWFYGMTIIGDPTLPFRYDEVPNDNPEKPLQPFGETEVEINKAFSYSSYTIDIDENKIWYLWDWGDGNFSNWLGPYESDEECIASHIWIEKNNFEIKVKAKDIYGKESDWSDPLGISMPKNKSYSIFNPWISRIIERFPILELLF